MGESERLIYSTHTHLFQFNPPVRIFLFEGYNEVVDLISRDKAPTGQGVRACSNEDMDDRACIQLQLGDGEEKPTTKASQPTSTCSVGHRCYFTACRFSLRDTSLAPNNILGLGSGTMGTEAHWRQPRLLRTRILHGGSEEAFNGDAVLESNLLQLCFNERGNVIPSPPRGAQQQNVAQARNCRHGSWCAPNILHGGDHPRDGVGQRWKRTHCNRMGH